MNFSARFAFVVSAVVLVCAASPAQAQHSPQLGEIFESGMNDCSSAPPLNFSLLPEGHRCEIQSPLSDDDSISVSLKSSIPCGCDVSKADAHIGDFRSFYSEIKCIAGGPGQITLTSKRQTRTVFVAAGEIAFFRADDKGHINCSAARWRNVSELLKSLEWPVRK
jgi:hypothetical protein